MTDDLVEQFDNDPDFQAEAQANEDLVNRVKKMREVGLVGATEEQIAAYSYIQNLRLNKEYTSNDPLPEYWPSAKRRDQYLNQLVGLHKLSLQSKENNEKIMETLQKNREQLLKGYNLNQ